MGKPTKAAENPYCKARIGCSAYNDILKSREGASEVTGIDRTRIAHIELDTVTPYPDEVVLMADAYSAPWLMNYHCSNQCPIGKQCVPKADICTIEQLTIRLCATLNDLNTVQSTMISIARDGKVSDDEVHDLKKIGDMLAQASKLYHEISIFTKGADNEK